MLQPTRRPVRATLTGLALAVSTCLMAPVAGATTPPATGTTALQAAAQRIDVASHIRAYAASHHLELHHLDEASCDDDTVVDQWVNQHMAQFSADEMAFLDLTWAEELPQVEADEQDADLDGADFALGEDAHVLTKEFTRLQHFWDIDGSSIKLGAMHGQMLTDRARVARAYLGLGLTQADAQTMAEYVVSYVDSHPVFEGGANPLMTLNAFSDAEPGQVGYRPRVIMGDGILEAYDELGYGDVAPQFILAHEYGHQVQAAIGMLGQADEDTVAGVRRIELHADTESAYFNSHPKGMAMQAKRVQEFLAVEYALGDCYTTEVSHHGTPAQRQAAGAWGYAQQESARPRSYVQPARTFLANFDKALPSILAAQ